MIYYRNNILVEIIRLIALYFLAKTPKENFFDTPLYKISLEQFDFKVIRFGWLLTKKTKKEKQTPH